MAYEFANLLDPRNTSSGLGEIAMIALVEWFVPGGIKSPGPWVTRGDDVRIKASHELKPGYGFIRYELAPDKNSYDAKSIGDTGFVKFANEAKITLPGSYAELHEALSDLAGKKAIVLIRDSDCVAGSWYQIGTDCIPARVASQFTTGSTKEGNKCYELSITNTASKVFLYEGDITYPGEGEDLIARLTGEKIGNIVTLDASTSTILVATTFEYKVMFNDINDDPKEIILPETGNTAVFNTDILTDWNAAGFAIILTITNGILTDRTRTADVTDEKPLIMGGFDEGFDTGFDFNVDIT